ncbi:hypothetical protein PHO31112_00941 [Pandoraea horticolens]|uniref:Uncharacterized protein n=1 Tax=Pandoraea horticolens TaxID=2508298 RepID=A0A5E4SSK3_9BURK|nr:hypothetical protein PHO31112_00941 [Pandoraea horticolens]
MTAQCEVRRIAIILAHPMTTATLGWLLFYGRAEYAWRAWSA